MAEKLPIQKYPRTPHLEGSRLQPGDEDLSQIPYSDIAGRHIVVEEKCDGANAYTGMNPPRARRISARPPEGIRHLAGRTCQ